MSRRIGVGIVGSGFMAAFHVRSWKGVRDGDIVAIASTNGATARNLAAQCCALDVGEPTVYQNIVDMVRQRDVEAVWVTAPNHVRIQIVEAITQEVRSGRSRVKAIAIEKPLARNVREARAILEMVEQAGLLHGYLENQVFTPSVVRGKEIIWRRGAAIAGPPYLARAAEEHGGPHRPWFWRGALQGGGVLSDMMCHSVEACRFMLTPLGERDYLQPIAVTASIAGLKWSQPPYSELLKKDTLGQVDYARAPSEDYANAEIVYQTPEGRLIIGQATTSWSFSGPGLRLTFELLGPEYSLSINSLDPGSAVFFSRNVSGPTGEDLVEKQAAEQGQMPYLSDEVHVYGYTDENQHMTAAFAGGRMPRESLRDGLLVTRLLMAAYKSAEMGCTVRFDPAGLDEFIPLVQQEKWQPRQLVDRAR